jgi:hypothetical protein
MINIIKSISKINLFRIFVPSYFYADCYKKINIPKKLEYEYQEWLKLTATPEEESACEKGLGQ